MQKPNHFSTSTTRIIPKITWSDLYKQQYNMEVLEKNIDNLQIKLILHTQVLTAAFCARYVLDSYYATCEEDVDLIDFMYVLRHQPQITVEELEQAYDEYSPFHHANIINQQHIISPRCLT
jgi:hypothetical protein